MHLYIRADADGKIGAGHIMRCIALAQAWQDQGGKATFISHCESDALKERIQSEGFRLVALDHVCPDSSDRMSTLSILKSENTNQIKWLVLDGYHFTPEYQKAIRDEGYRVMVIDDMNHLLYYHADILLNQNIHAPDLQYHCDDDTTLLLGTRYVLLRREFLKYRDFKRRIPERARNILVTLGGADPYNVTLKVIGALKLLNEPDIMVRIIIGPANPNQETLRKAIASAHFEAEFLTNPPNVPDLMEWADMAVSASGSTCWELAYMRVPTLIMIFADNQEGIASGLGKKGAMINLGWFDDNSIINIAKSIKKIIMESRDRYNLSHNGHYLVDGKGVLRVQQSIRNKTDYLTQ